MPIRVPLHCPITPPLPKCLGLLAVPSTCAVAIRRFFLPSSRRDAIKPSFRPVLTRRLTAPSIDFQDTPKRVHFRCWISTAGGGHLSFGWPAALIPKLNTPSPPFALRSLHFAACTSQLCLQAVSRSCSRPLDSIQLFNYKPNPAEHLSSYTSSYISNEDPTDRKIPTTTHQPPLLYSPLSTPYHHCQNPRRASPRRTPRLQWLGRQRAM